jgi:uncharacterized protein (TIGR03067 family)
MRTIVATAALMVLLAGRLATVQAGGEGDVEKFRGTWTVSGCEKAGQKAPAEEVKKLGLIFTESEFTWKTGAHDVQGTFSLDATKSPRQITMSHEGKKLAGIYRLEGDELKICISHGDDRPVDFTTKDGTMTMLLVLKREKP